MKEITKYFRNAVLASSQGTIEYKEGQFATISLAEIKNRIINQKALKVLWKDLDEEDDEFEQDERKSKNVIIAMKTIASEFLESGHEQVNLDEMTSILFLPAQVDKSGILYQPDDKYPWIPREFLQPMVEPQISVGTSEDYDEYFEKTTDERNQIESWNQYLDYAKNLYEAVTKTNFFDDQLPEQKIKTDGKYYIFLDKTVAATFHITQLYNHLLNNSENELYSKMTNGKIEVSKVLSDKFDFNKMIYHVGQMGGEYPLSPSQREAVSNFEEIREGEVLAVNGPPGTGKTTLLQTIVANMYVKAALRREKAPIIVATSTNNQAVTNIIDSFGKINPIGIDNLEKRWITGVNSFSLYFPAKGKIKEAKNNKYQYTRVQGGYFVEDIEAYENREKSEEIFIQEFSKYFDKSEVLLEQCESYLHNKLKGLEEKKINCIHKIEAVKQFIGDIEYYEFLNSVEGKINNLCEELKKLKREIDSIRERGEELSNRCLEWRKSYEGLPWYVRLFKFISYFNKKIVSWSYENMTLEESEFLKRGMTIEEIESKYYELIEENDKHFHDVQKTIQDKEKQEEQLIKKRESLLKFVQEVVDALLQFSDYHVEVPKDLIENFDIEKVNNTLDKVRYVEFWLAVHYYEVRWLNEENPIKGNQKGKTFENVLDQMYHRIAMLTPCMVMTCFMLPKQFLAYDNNDKKHYYMYNYIDLLIVDEAGQISPEIGIPSFALAKKAVVVGDEQQIPPVWGNQRALDVAMAISNEVIDRKEDFKMLEENGLNSSQSSVMKVASLSCPFEKYGKGLFLSEHRRCYNEIIQYCNDLVYNGKLEPLRGQAKKDDKNVLAGYFPPMGHKQIDTSFSQKDGNSRRNVEEAKVIIQWIESHYTEIIKKYEKEAEENNESFDKKTVLGIITPFKSQSNYIKRLLKQELPQIEEYISVGTVHTFQGAERKVIIFSSVYGNEDGCFFINKNKSLMNAAVSRAKDSFLVFGDRGCLCGEKTSAGAMLKRATSQEIELK